MTGRLFAIIPAAGRSRRMGRPKLLLPLGGRIVIARLLEVLDRPEITQRLVVVRRDDADLRKAVEQSGGTVVLPERDPPDMRASVACALAKIAEYYQPTADDGWLLIPADHPVLNPRVLNALLAVWHGERPLILVPRCGERRGHPTLFRWSVAEEVSQLPSDQGLNRLLHQHAGDVREMYVEDASVLWDLDTPEDYEAVQQFWTRQGD